MLLGTGTSLSATWLPVVWAVSGLLLLGFVLWLHPWRGEFVAAWRVLARSTSLWLYPSILVASAIGAQWWWQYGSAGQEASAVLHVLPDPSQIVLPAFHSSLTTLPAMATGIHLIVEGPAVAFGILLLANAWGTRTAWAEGWAKASGSSLIGGIIAWLTLVIGLSGSLFWIKSVSLDPLLVQCLRWLVGAVSLAFGLALQARVWMAASLEFLHGGESLSEERAIWQVAVRKSVRWWPLVALILLSYAVKEKWPELLEQKKALMPWVECLGAFVLLPWAALVFFTEGEGFLGDVRASLALLRGMGLSLVWWLALAATILFIPMLANHSLVAPFADSHPARAVVNAFFAAVTTALLAWIGGSWAAFVSSRLSATSPIKPRSRAKS